MTLSYFNIATPSYNAAFLEIVSRVEILCVLFSEFPYGRRPLKSQMECKITSNKSVSSLIKPRWV